jgi:hypothetical protein
MIGFVITREREREGGRRALKLIVNAIKAH